MMDFLKTNNKTGWLSFSESHPALFNIPIIFFGGDKCEVRQIYIKNDNGVSDTDFSGFCFGSIFRI